MSSPNAPRKFPRTARLLLALTLAGLTAGCFQPLYGERSIVGGAAIRDKMGSVEVAPVRTSTGNRLPRVGVEVRNELIFDLTGGSGGSGSAYRLDISLSASQLQVIVDINSGRPDIQNYSIDASYAMVEVATGRQVVSGTAFSRVSYNIPGQLQRYAGDRGLRDAENRAAKAIADNIRTRLASYFTAGT